MILPKIRDPRFITLRRGGTLQDAHHRLLIRWACDCAEHVLPLLGERIDGRLRAALETAKAWERGEVATGAAQKASVAAHAAARESSSPTAIAVARAVGHAVATAHMADHSLGAAEYALKAIKAAGGSVELERAWQDEQLPAEVRELVLSGRETIR